MRNPFIWIGLIAIIVLVVFFFINPLIPFVGGFLPFQSITLIILIPFVLGLLIGFFLGMRRRPRPVPTTSKV
jgi:hypothetical protein